MSDPQTSLHPDRRGFSPPRSLEVACRVLLDIPAGVVMTDAELSARVLTLRRDLDAWRAKAVSETGCCPVCGYPACLGSCWLGGVL